MMSLMNLWGLLALTSLLILLLIYILKPNFQQKFISSTFIWKLSLKYKKKKLPINKFRNILLIICQILILCLLTTIIVKPVQIFKTVVENESIFILDASSSMRTTYEDETRFERALEQLKTKVNNAYDEGSTVSIVVASKNPYFIVERLEATSRYDVEKIISDMSVDVTCTYGEADLQDAINLCQEILVDNPNAKMTVLTDTVVDYVDDGISIIDVSKSGEYNVAILDAYSEIIDNYYSYTVDLACYGRNENVAIELNVYGANKTEELPHGTSFTFSDSIDLDNDTPKRIVFINSSVDISDNEDDENTYYYQIPDNDKIFSYESVNVQVKDVDDSYPEDNIFEIYGGEKETLKIVYATSQVNPFVNGILLTLKSSLNEKYNIEITEVKKGAAPYEGYDIYVYEHEMQPLEAPKDGLAIYMDPLAETANSGFRFSQYRDLSKQSLPFTEEAQTELNKNMTADSITVSRYTILSSYDTNYKVLMSCDNNPMIMYSDEGNLKSVVMMFSLHYSNFSILKEFPLFFLNIFNYYFPSTIDSNSFEVSDTVKLNTRSPLLTIEGNSINETIDTFPATLSVDVPGVYTIRQTTYFNKDVVEQFYVRLPKEESNIFNEIETLTNPVPVTTTDDLINDLMFYFAIALASLVFVEWILKGKEGI